MSDWIRLDPSSFSSRATTIRRERGVEVAVTLSPYDVPDAVRGRFDPTLSRFVIEFRYIENEDWDRRVHDEDILLRVGRNSGRLLGIEVDVKGLRAKQVGLVMHLPKLVNRAIDDELRSAKRKSRTQNYELAKSVISDERKPLFAEIANP